MNLEVNGSPQNGPAIPLQNLPANGWVEIGDIDCFVKPEWCYDYRDHLARCHRSQPADVIHR